MNSTRRHCEVRANFDTVRDECGSKKNLEASGWSNFTGLVDSALGAGIVRQTEGDGRIKWLTLKAPTAPVVAAAATVQDSKTKMNVIPDIQNQAQGCAIESMEPPRKTGLKTRISEKATEEAHSIVTNSLTKVRMSENRGTY